MYHPDELTHRAISESKPQGMLGPVLAVVAVPNIYLNPTHRFSREQAEQFFAEFENTNPYWNGECLSRNADGDSGIVRGFRCWVQPVMGNEQGPGNVGDRHNVILHDDGKITQVSSFLPSVISVDGSEIHGVPSETIEYALTTAVAAASTVKKVHGEAAATYRVSVGTERLPTLTEADSKSRNLTEMVFHPFARNIHFGRGENEQVRSLVLDVLNQYGIEETSETVV